MLYLLYIHMLYIFRQTNNSFVIINIYFFHESADESFLHYFDGIRSLHDLCPDGRRVQQTTEPSAKEAADKRGDVEASAGVPRRPRSRRVQAAGERDEAHDSGSRR